MRVSNMQLLNMQPVVRGMVIVGTILALMLAGGAPTENTHGEDPDVATGAESSPTPLK